MKTNLFKYMLIGSLAMSGAYADAHDGGGDKKGDGVKEGKLVVDKDGNIFTVLGFNSDRSMAYVIKVFQMDVDELETKIKEDIPKDFKS